MSLLAASFSLEDLAVRMESISSMNTIEGENAFAIWKRVRMRRSLSPTHFESRVLALMLKKVLLHSEAHAFANIVFPFPGGPYSKIPRVGFRKPVKMSGRN